MGADIHGLVEKNVRLDGVDRWVTISILRYPDKGRERNYSRFAALAGVRGEGPTPKGAPSDLSETARLLLREDAEDTHSISWLPLDDALRIYNETEWYEDEDKRKWLDSYRYFGVECEDGHRYRLVFWFDD